MSDYRGDGPHSECGLDGHYCSNRCPKLARRPPSVKSMVEPRIGRPGKFKEQQERARKRLDALPPQARPVVTRPLVQSRDTVPRVPRPRGEMSAPARCLIEDAKQRRDDADADYRSAVVHALSEGASFAEVAKFTGLSTNTLQRWKREAT